MGAQQPGQPFITQQTSRNQGSEATTTTLPAGLRVQGGYPLLVVAPEGTCSNGRCLLLVGRGVGGWGQCCMAILLKGTNQGGAVWHGIRLRR